MFAYRARRALRDGDDPIGRLPAAKASDRDLTTK
jgi:hypothetical protein